jgi:PAS domain S-box-containing protein
MIEFNETAELSRVTVDDSDDICALKALDGIRHPRSPLENHPAIAETGPGPLAWSLDERVRFEALIADLSAAFVNLPPAKVDERIGDALRQVVEFLGADRADFGEVSENDLTFRLTHSYTARGFPHSPPAIPESHLPWYSTTIRQGDVMKLVPLPDSLPEEGASKREHCVAAGLKSQLTIPLNVGRSVQFAIGGASSQESRQWPDELVQRLRLLGEVFANALARKRTDEELHRRDRLYRDLVELTRAVTWQADALGNNTTFIAPQVVDLLGYPVDAWYREGFWASRLHPDDRGRVLSGVGEAVRTGRQHDIEYRLMAADGGTVWVHDLVNVRPDGGPSDVLRGVMIDITARKQIEAEAARLRERLAQTSRMTTLGELSAAIAHEINQPLCAIVSNAETTQEYLANGSADMAEVHDALQDIVADGRRASDIIRRIRALLRTRQTERAPFDLNGAIREVLTVLHHRFMRDGILVATDVATDLPPALGDRVQVQQVILNLLVNAAEAVVPGPADRRRVTVSTASDGQMVTVSVRDTGPGLSADLLDRVFDAFFTTKAEGTGIGLSISRTIVEAQGGRIWAGSALGCGVTFTFTLPVDARSSP